MVANRFVALSITLLGSLVASCGDGSVGNLPPEVSLDSEPIVGGSTATLADWPWIVSLRDAYGHYCGGSLIAPNWVVTAAHCNSPSSVRVGPNSKTAVSRNVSSRIVHPNFKSSTFENDIALLKLSQAVNNVATAPLNTDYGFPSVIPLADANSSVTPNTRIAGWGTTSEKGEPVDTLREAAIPALTNASCATVFQGYLPVYDNEICAGYESGGVNACYGDSGGPLIISFGDSLLAGIASWGKGCARKDLPTIYTRVSSHLDWINNNVSGVRTVSPTAIIMATLIAVSS
jgi:trypsin